MPVPAVRDLAMGVAAVMTLLESLNRLMRISPSGCARTTWAISDVLPLPTGLSRREGGGLMRARKRETELGALPVAADCTTLSGPQRYGG
jgi:hypothetical protein